MADDELSAQRAEDMAADADTADTDEATEAPPPTRAGVATGWLRAALARRMADARSLPFDEPPLTPVVAADAASRAERAGEVIAALAPGAPRGVSAPEGAPRVALVVGRETQIERALALLADGIALCIHSDGAPGVGKTIFAIEVAARAAERELFPGGAVWIACETLSGEGGLAEVVTRVARGLRAETALAALDPDGRRAALRAALLAGAERTTLLALDNIEPTLDTSALLDIFSGGSVTPLLTTRHALDDARVTPFALAPLAIADAAQLLASRLRLRDATRPTPEEEPLVARLAEALGGLPLAIDLAAAMVGIYGLPLDEMLGKAEADSGRGPVAALRALIDRHWQALVPVQSRTLAGLTLVDGATFPRAVALAVARAAQAEPAAGGAWDADGLPVAAARTLDELIGLGMVEAMAAGRLRLHPQTRQRIVPRLSELGSDAGDALGLAMAGWWLDYARAHGGYEGRAGLEAEAAGLMGALTWAHAHGHWRLTLDLAETLGEAWQAHGRRDEALRTYAWAVEAANAAGEPRERLWARYQLAVAQTEAGQLPQAREGFAAALALAREVGDAQVVRDGAHALAAVAVRLGDDEQAREGFSEALALARAAEDAAATRDELHGLAILDLRADRLEEARAEYTEALDLARGLGDSGAMYLERYGLALVERAAGDAAQARAGFAAALDLARELGDHGATSDALAYLGALDAQGGDEALARAELAEALALAEALTDTRRAARALVGLAEVAAASGQARDASERFELAQALYSRLGDAEAERVAERMLALGLAS
ncbi:MAG TPA: hypothetical protein VF725_08115 [Ktedonobacterales bacterium]